jgi:hypothetical protein
VISVRLSFFAAWRVEYFGFTIYHVSRFRLHGQTESQWSAAGRAHKSTEANPVKGWPRTQLPKELGG